MLVQNHGTEPEETLKVGKDHLLRSFQVFCSTGETARGPCPFSEAEQKAFVLDLC